MAKIVYEDIWNMMSFYDFDFDAELIKDFKCIICKKLLNNAYRSPCGCRYCFLCIEKYLLNENNYCPGVTSNCQDHPIVLQRDLQFDLVTNKKISTFKVQCPENLCEVKCELRDIKSHIETHKNKCPYSQIGCSGPSADLNSMKEHLNVENLLHSNLLMNFIQNVENEIGSLKDILNRKEKQIEELTEANVKLQQDMMNEYKQCKDDIQRNKTAIDELIVDVKRRELNEIDIKERLSNLEVNQVDQSDSELSCDDYDDYDDYNDPYDGYTLRSMLVNHVNMVNGSGPYEWKIEDFINLRNSARSGLISILKSPTFYSHLNGYKMQMRIHPNGANDYEHTHLSVEFCLLEDNDYYLSWPMKKEVTISLMDQTTDQAHISKTYSFHTVGRSQKCVFFKPSNRIKSDDEYFYGTDNFINSNALVNNAKICYNGTIVLKCTVG